MISNTSFGAKTECETTFYPDGIPPQCDTVLSFIDVEYLAKPYQRTLKAHLIPSAYPCAHLIDVVEALSESYLDPILAHETRKKIMVSRFEFTMTVKEVTIGILGKSFRI